MMLYAYVVSGTVVDYRQINGSLDLSKIKHINGRPVLVPVRDIYPPAPRLTYAKVTLADVSVQDAEVVRTYIDVPLDIAEAWRQVRETRNRLLVATDKYTLSDFPISEDGLALIKLYRQQLRDITQTAPTPEKVIWPSAPKL